ncbi:MAG: nucleotidyltransferase domain-containing protein [Hellea sp.]|nr:nucleotidyltransferase domain-containing protein [Hellea sp.]
MDLTKEHVNQIIEWAKRHTEIKQIFLFGSRARGESQAKSDIDLAVVMNTDKGPDFAYSMWSNWHRKYKRRPDLSLPFNVHLEWYEENAGLEIVAPSVEREGILIYAILSKQLN